MGISIIIVLLIVATLVAYSLKSVTEFGTTKCVILGVTLAPFALFELFSMIVNFLSNMGKHIGLTLGGSSAEDLAQSSVTRLLRDMGTQVGGDTSEKTSESDTNSKEQ